MKKFAQYAGFLFANTDVCTNLFDDNRILVSACLAGFECNYKGESRPDEKIISLVEKRKAVPVCPEYSGGLDIPRSGARILSGHGKDVLDGKSTVVDDNGVDVTAQYIKGAEYALELAEFLGIKNAVLKQGSPSCGKGLTQGGIESRELLIGNGVTTELLERNGIKVFSEEDIQDENIWRLLEEEFEENYF